MEDAMSLVCQRSRVEPLLKEADIQGDEHKFTPWHSRRYLSSYHLFFFIPYLPGPPGIFIWGYLRKPA